MQPTVVLPTSGSEATPTVVDNHSSMDVSEVVVRDTQSYANDKDNATTVCRAVQEAEAASVKDVDASGDAEPTSSTPYASTLAGLSSLPRSLTTSFFTSYSSSSAATKSDASSTSVNPAAEKQPIFAEKRKLAVGIFNAH